MFIWYGLLSIGCAPAMINYNLATDALVHCVRLSGSRILIVDNDPGCLERFEGSKDRIVSELGVKPVVLSQELRADIAMSNSSRPADSYRAQGQDKIPIALIYTRSGSPKDQMASCTNASIVAQPDSLKPFPSI